MRKAIATTVVAVSLFLPGNVLATGNDTVALNYLLMPNFVDTHCQTFKPLRTILELDERFYNKVGYGTGAVSCKGEVCWSWEKGKGHFDWQLYSSNIPVRISNVEKISKSISQTVKNSQSLRKNTSDVLNTVQEFLQTSFGTGKEQNITKERTITESKSQEQSIETNTTPLFHRFLAMGLQNAFPAIYPFCFSSATDLFFRAYNTNRANDLIEAFVIFQTIKSQDLKFSNEKNFLNRAKFLYIIPGQIDDKTVTQFLWASSVLFAKLLEWDEFQDVRKIVDDYIDKVYEKYQLLKNHTAKELLQIDKELAVLKYGADEQLQKENKTQDINEVEDKYASFAALRFYTESGKGEYIKQLQQRFDEALKKNDPLLEARFIKEDLTLVKIIKEKPKVVAGVGAGAVIGITGIAGTLYFRKKKQNKEGML